MQRKILNVVKPYAVMVIYVLKSSRHSLPLKKVFLLPLRLSCKESSTFSPSPSSSGSGDVTALRCSEPLRSKVGGPSKVFARLCGMEPPVYRIKLLYNSMSLYHFSDIRDFIEHGITNFIIW